MKSPSETKSLLKKLAIRFVVFLSVVFGCIFLYFFVVLLFTDNTVPSVTSRDGAFQIDSQTILDSLDHDKTGVFTPRTMEDSYQKIDYRTL